MMLSGKSLKRIVVGRWRNPYSDLEKRLGYRFRKRHLIEEALTHRSYRFENKEIESDNQRLEYLGDAVLGFITAAHAFEQFREMDEGAMTSFRSQVASGKALARIARDLELGEYIRIGRGEEQTGGRRKASCLADALEAVIGAAYLDGGMRAAEKVYRTVFVPMMSELTGDVWTGNPKGKLQEVCQTRWRQGPRYRVVRQEGPAHSAVFTVEAEAPGGARACGTGRNIRSAEAAAAQKLLRHIGADD